MRTKKDIRLPVRTARWFHVIIFVCVCFATGAKGDATDRVWVLRFEDNFERTDLGREWRTNDAIIQDGRMLLGRNGPACAKLVRPFPGDVKIEFTAQANEKKPPCDLSVTLAAERFRTMSWNYLLAFGGVNNTVNKLTGGRRLKKLIDKNPERLIEPGRIYRLVAVKEGKQLSLTVDGKRLLESTDEEVMGGLGFDAVGLVTWNGMYVDNVRIYERRVPHPDTPQYVMKLTGLILATDNQNRLVGPLDLSSNAKKAVNAYNQGNLAQAEELFASLKGEVRAAGLAYVYGHLNHDDSPQDF